MCLPSKRGELLGRSLFHKLAQTDSSTPTPLLPAFRARQSPRRARIDKSQITGEKARRDQAGARKTAEKQVSEGYMCRGLVVPAFYGTPSRSRRRQAHA